jgi:hypothetical protein
MEHVLPDLLRSLLNGEWTRPFFCQTTSWQVHELVCCGAWLGAALVARQQPHSLHALQLAAFV